MPNHIVCLPLQIHQIWWVRVTVIVKGMIAILGYLGAKKNKLFSEPLGTLGPFC
ncbi:hypothetical protein L873DRAFT_1807178 [Choiromyces venosus 120613-1]|uniref:Uncharacterized protein n=1 Tax=Choiromyces venosus 120613-1 TaxID=1336337 RepID=A0A3N4JQZ0_9PEZI|nr:hypothetical protein L873DRAFT_1807178 [Choiromyces venosus 120613-1]